MQTWLKFENDTDEEPTHTANVFTGRDEVRITLWNEGACQVTTVHKDTMTEAEQWLESAGFQDFTA